jgi:hypothetical protein
MEPTTLIMAISITALVSGAALLVTRKKEVSRENVERARERALERNAVRAFADTCPANIRSDLEYSTAGITVTDDTGDIPLTEEQISTINLIFDGYSIGAKHRTKNSLGPSSLVASGVPLNLSAFDDDNKVVPPRAEAEYLEPDYTWPEAHCRG